MNLICSGSGSTGNSYYLEIEGTRLLIEAGVSLTNIFKKVSSELIGKVDAVLVSHEHGDHSKYLKKISKFVLEIYLTQGTMDALKIHGDYHYHAIKRGKSFTIKGLTVFPIESFHDAVNPVNFIISGKHEKTVYITDTGLIPYVIPNMTHLMLEANYSDGILTENAVCGCIDDKQYDRIKHNHLNIGQVIDFLKRSDTSKLEKIYLIHLSDRNSDEYEFKKSVQELTGIDTECLK